MSVSREIIRRTAETAPPNPQTAFVRQMRRVPGAVAIVATAQGQERTGFAATAWNSLCADPPMLLVCVKRSASAYDLVLRARAFSINLLPAGATETVAIFSAQRGLERADRFLPGYWRDGPLGQPMFRDAIASFECALEATHDHGTHTILIGRVGQTAGNDEDVTAMLYHDGSFAYSLRLD